MRAMVGGREGGKAEWLGWRSKGCDGAAGGGTGWPLPAFGRGRHYVLRTAPSRRQPVSAMEEGLGSRPSPQARQVDEAGAAQGRSPREGEAGSDQVLDIPRPGR